MNEIEWLETWYQQNCDGQWEHLYGIEIGTLDNPGWYVNIDLNETPYKNFQMKEIKRDQKKDDWIRCVISDGIFKGVGDSLKLNEILQIFRRLIESKKDI